MSAQTSTRTGLTMQSMKLSRRMVNAEPWVIGSSLLIPLVGSTIGKVTGNNSKMFNPSFLTPASNLLLSLFAAVGYQSSMPLAGLGNYLYAIQELFRMNHSTLQFGNTAFAFLPSALIGAAWGADSDKKADEHISKEKGVLRKLSAQLEFVHQYWTKDFPEIFKDPLTKIPNFIREVKEKPLEKIGKLDRHFIMFHSMASMIATVLLITGIVINKLIGTNKEPIQEDSHFIKKTFVAYKDLNNENIISKLGWLIGQIGMAPLIIFTMLNGFNGHIIKKYGSFGKLLPITSLAYGITTLASIIFKPFAHIAIFTDFLRHIASSTFGHLKRRGQLMNQGI